MAIFTSDRERRYWFLALAVVAAIYSTAGLAGTLARVLRESDLLGLAFGIAFLLVIAAIIGSVVKQRPGGREGWVMLGVTAVYGMIVVRMGVSPEERSHLFEFGLLAVFIHQALTERRGPDSGILKPAALAVLVTALLGWIDEGIQWLIPSRVYDIRDVGINALAGLMAVLARLVLMWAQRRWGRAR